MNLRVLLPTVSFFPVLALAPAGSSQTGIPGEPAAQRPPEIVRVGENTFSLRWHGVSGRTYFVQSSADLVRWRHMPVIKSGQGAPLTHNFSGDGTRMFLRLSHTDRPTTSPNSDDFDGDGISNWDEIRTGGTGTNPFAADSNNDGIRDDGLVYAAQNDPDGAGLPPSLDAGLTGRWDFEQPNVNSYPNLANAAYPAIVGGSVPADNGGIISKASNYGSNGDWLKIDPRIFSQNTSNSISLWFSFEKDWVQNKSMAIPVARRTVFWSYNSSYNTYPRLVLSTLKAVTANDRQKIFLSTYENGVMSDLLTAYVPHGKYIDDAKWHQLTFVQNSAVASIWLDGVKLAELGVGNRFVVNATADGWFTVGKTIPSGATPMDDTNFRGKIDRLRTYGRALTAAEIDALYKQDADGDSLYDWFETSYRRDRAASFDAPELDDDRDGLTNHGEQQLGTDPRNFDTDGDFLPDGFEHKHQFDPLSPESPNGADDDPDGDGLTNYGEYANGSSPVLPDTDGDGVGDSLEVANGSDPNDASDGGEAPDEEDIEEVPFHIYGDYASWEMVVTGQGPDDKRVLRLHTESPGGSNTRTIKLHKGNKYEVRMKWLQSKKGEEDTWYCWEAQVGGKPQEATYHDHNPARREGVAEAFVVGGHWLVENKGGLLTKHVHMNDGESGGGNVAAPLKATLLPVEMVPDYNRDGKIDHLDRGKVTEENPWRFWVNDDNDKAVEEAEEDGSDVPGQSLGSQDANDLKVDGMRDLIDFFPLHLDMKQTLEVFSPDKYKYVLKHEDAALKYYQFPACIIDGSDPGHAPDRHVKHIGAGRALAVQALQLISPQGAELSAKMLRSAKEGKGVIVLEGVKETAKPLVLEILKKEDNSSVVEIEFPISLSGVEDMFRHNNLRPLEGGQGGAGDRFCEPANKPDDTCNNKWFVFCHGYNVNGEDARGWASEFYKKLYWSGSNAKFYAISWRGDDGQVTVGSQSLTANYQVNVNHAFGTADDLAFALNRLDGEVTIAAHSLGNVLVGSAVHDWGARPANYFMIDSAVAKETYDAAEAQDQMQDRRMTNPLWKYEDKILRASEWHTLFDGGTDKRKRLTWKDRLGDLLTSNINVYNFYSTGEEVLANPEADEPTLGTIPPLSAEKVWAFQEKRKGWGMSGYIHTSNYGGWKFNWDAQENGHNIYFNGSTPISIPAIDAEFKQRLKRLPYFDDSLHPELFTEEEGESSGASDYADTHRNTLLAEMIPATTLSAGANSMNALKGAVDRNYDMNNMFMSDPSNWPYEDGGVKRWLHSHIREVAYTHQYKVYDKFVQLGGLNDKPNK